MSWWEQRGNEDKWMFQNLSSETVPGYACLGLDPHEEADRHTTEATATWDRNARCLQARKPTSFHEAAQHPGLVAFNMRDPVLKNAYGWCTLQKPAIVLVDRNEELHVGDPVGPRAGCWHLSQVGDAFVYMGEDVADPFDWTASVTIDSTSVSVHYGTGIVDVMPFSSRVVKTPAAGIPARSGTDLHSVLCDAYRERFVTGGGVEGTLAALLNAAGNPYQIEVHNLINDEVLGNKYVVTSRLLSGMRYVVVESCSAEA